MPEDSKGSNPEAVIHKEHIREMAFALAGEQSLNLQAGDILVVNCDEWGYGLFQELIPICEEKEVTVRLADNGVEKVTNELLNLQHRFENGFYPIPISDHERHERLQEEVDAIAGVHLYEGANKMIALRGFPGRIDYKTTGITKEIQDSYEKSAQKNRDVRAGKDNVVIMMPTPKEAEELGMDFDEYVNRFMEAGGKHDWAKYYEAQKVLIERLNQGKYLEIHQYDETAPEGWREMSLTVKLRKKDDGKDSWANSTIRRNYPGGEIFTGPQDVNGLFCVAGLMDFDGILLHGIKFQIDQNQVVLDSVDILVSEEANKEEILSKILEILKQDEGASKIGELGIGTNNLIIGPQINAVLREKKLGIHLAIGSSYSEYNTKPYPDGSDVNLDNGVRSMKHIDVATTTYKGLVLKLDGKIFMLNGAFYNEEEVIDPRVEILNSQN